MILYFFLVFSFSILFIYALFRFYKLLFPGTVEKIREDKVGYLLKYIGLAAVVFAVSYVVIIVFVFVGVIKVSY